MRTAAELKTKIDHLTALKAETSAVFAVLPLSKQKHAVLTAFARTIDNEIELLRWVLGELDNTWSDGLLQYVDILDYFEQIPLTEYPRLPHRQELVKNRPAAS